MPADVRRPEPLRDPPSKSIGVLYDHRDEMAAIAKLVVLQLAVLQRPDRDGDQQPLARGRASSSRCRRSTRRPRRCSMDVEADVARATGRARSAYWEVVAEQFPEWQRSATGGQRGRGPPRLHPHATASSCTRSASRQRLLATEQDAGAGSASSREAAATIDWHRSERGLWEGRAMVGGKVSKSAAQRRCSPPHQSDCARPAAAARRAARRGRLQRGEK